MPNDELHKLLETAKAVRNQTAEGGAVAGEAANGGAEDAAFTELVRLVRLLVRSGMGRKLRDHRDSADVCQSIARSFIEDHQASAINFGSEQQLVAYLRTVVRSKLASLARTDNALKRGGLDGHAEFDESRALRADSKNLPDPLAPEMNAEAAGQIDNALTDDDRELARLRLRGMDWDQIGAHLRQDPQTIRKRWSRLLARLGNQQAGGAG